MKRTLAVLLAMLLALGVFAVAASAAVITPSVSEDYMYDSDADTIVDTEIFEITFQDVRPDPAKAIVLTDQLYPTMKLKATIELEAGYPGDLEVEDVADAKFFWFVGDVTDAAVASGKQGDTYTITDADIDKYITVIALLDVGAGNVDKIGAGDQILYIAAFVDKVNTLDSSYVNTFAAPLAYQLEAVGLIEIEHIAGVVWNATATAAGADLAAPLADLIAKYQACMNAEDVSTGATAAQKKAAATAYLNAVNALEAAAQAFANDMFDSVIAATNDWLAFLQGIDASKLTAKNAVKLIGYIRDAEENALDLAQLKRAFNQYTKWTSKYTWAQGFFADIAEFYGDTEFLRAIYELGTPATNQELQDLLDQIADLLEQIEELENQPPEVIEVPGPSVPVPVDPAWYELGIYKLLGVGSWGETLKAIVYYVLFGWRFGAYA